MLTFTINLCVVVRFPRVRYIFGGRLSPAPQSAVAAISNWMLHDGYQRLLGRPPTQRPESVSPRPVALQALSAAMQATPIDQHAAPESFTVIKRREGG